jgi:hypothetical protein
MWMDATRKPAMRRLICVCMHVWSCIVCMCVRACFCVFQGNALQHNVKSLVPRACSQKCGPSGALTDSSY